MSIPSIQTSLENLWCWSMSQRSQRCYTLALKACFKRWISTSSRSSRVGARKGLLARVDVLPEEQMELQGALHHRRGTSTFVFISEEEYTTHILNDPAQLDFFLPGWCIASQCPDLMCTNYLLPWHFLQGAFDRKLQWPTLNVYLEDYQGARVLNRYPNAKVSAWQLLFDGRLVLVGVA